MHKNLSSIKFSSSLPKSGGKMGKEHCCLVSTESLRFFVSFIVHVLLFEQKSL